MHLIAWTERARAALNTINGQGPEEISDWTYYLPLGVLLSEAHSVTVWLAAQSVKEGDTDKYFNTPLSHGALERVCRHAPDTLRRIGVDVRSLIENGDRSSIVYLEALTAVQDALIETLKHSHYLVGT